MTLGFIAIVAVGVLGIYLVNRLSAGEPIGFDEQQFLV